MNTKANIQSLKDNFLKMLQQEAKKFTQSISTEQGDWIVKGFIDVSQNIYTISVDTKVISKIIELLLFPHLCAFAQKNNLKIILSKEQNFYPDITFIDNSGNKFAVDIKSTYRKDENTVNGMTLGAFTGYFRDRKSTKNINFPYDDYVGHFVLGVIYSRCDDELDERKIYQLNELKQIRSVVRNFQFFAQEKYKIAADRPGSGNTKNIGGVTNISDLVNGHGPFTQLGEEIFTDYWTHYLTKDMAAAAELAHPYYTNLKQYLSFKNLNK